MHYFNLYPHAGYPVANLDHNYDNAINTVTWAYQHTRSVVIGGDFNTVLTGNQRSQKLYDFIGRFNLTLANEQENEPMNDKWTFQSSLGVRRQLDYIRVGPNLQSVESSPSNLLCMGSDHRAVKSISKTKYGDIGSVPTKQKTKKLTIIDNYDIIVTDHLRCNIPTSIADLEKDGAIRKNPDIPIPDQNYFKFDRHLQSLRDERRTCRGNKRRPEITKYIMKNMRQQ